MTESTTWSADAPLVPRAVKRNVLVVLSAVN
jgi:hypothetical protein